MANPERGGQEPPQNRKPEGNKGHARNESPPLSERLKEYLRHIPFFPKVRPTETDKQDPPPLHRRRLWGGYDIKGEKPDEPRDDSK